MVESTKAEHGLLPTVNPRLEDGLRRLSRAQDRSEDTGRGSGVLEVAFSTDFTRLLLTVIFPCPEEC